MSDARDYGSRYWCAKVPKELSKSGEIYVFADEVHIDPSGAVLFVSYAQVRNSDGDLLTTKALPYLVLPPGQWYAVFAASCLDGHAVAVEHWKGEVDRGRD